jgi:hypothetical protein
MRIPLLTSLNQPELSYLNNVVILKTPHKIVSANFILDTGSPTTILSYIDAFRLQIPFNNLTKTRIVKLGGRKYQGYSFDRLTFMFKSEDNKLIKEDFSVCVIKPTSEKEEQELSNVPTIIGTDFLKEKRYILFCDMDKGIAYLEKKI